jgi:hypothetical protein
MRCCWLGENKRREIKNPSMRGEQQHNNDLQKE